MRTVRVSLMAAAAVAGVFLGSNVLRADNIAMDLPRTQPGNQNGGYSLGEDFTVGAAGVTVTGLAAFDPYSGGNNVTLGTGGADSIPVKIYYQDVAGHNAGDLVPGASAVITSANSSFASADSSYLVVNNFTPVDLSAGTYRLVASNYVNELEYNSGGAATSAVTSYSGPLISFPSDSGSGFNNFPGNASSTAEYPTGNDGGPINRYGAASFTFTATASPEPSSLALLAGFGLLALRRRRSV